MTFSDIVPWYIIEKWLKHLHGNIIAGKVHPKREGEVIVCGLGPQTSSTRYGFSFYPTDKFTFILAVDKYIAHTKPEGHFAESIDRTSPLWPTAILFYEKVMAYIDASQKDRDFLEAIDLLMTSNTRYR